jgi:hypothetical protein
MLTNPFAPNALPVNLNAQGRANINKFLPAEMQALLLANIAAMVKTAAKVVGETFARPGDTTAYADLDLVANSATNTSVVPIVLNTSRGPGLPGLITRASIFKSTTSITLSSFRALFFGTLPVLGTGDNAALSTSAAGYLGRIDIVVDQAFASGGTYGAAGVGIPAANAQVPFYGDIWALIQAKAAYAPGASETFTLILDVEQS